MRGFFTFFPGFSQKNVKNFRRIFPKKRSALFSSDLSAIFYLTDGQKRIIFFREEYPFFRHWFLTKMRVSSPLHTSVLLSESLENLIGEPRNGPRTFVDATLGLAGHSLALREKLSENDLVVGIDRDGENLKRAEELVGKSSETGAKFVAVHDSFANLGEILDRMKIEKVDGVLYDLGVSSIHYDDPERGFSIRENGPLDMRFDRTEAIPTAADLVAVLGERELFRIFRDYADEPKGIFIAKAIVEARKRAPIRTTGELQAIVKGSSFDPKSPLRVFQALRIAVNSELDAVETSLKQAVLRLKPKGRLAVITFHSIEDRLVKTVAKAYETPKIDEITGRVLEKPILKKIHKKPIEPTPEEILSNPRSRSAKLRIYEKT